MSRRLKIALVWAQFAPYHVDRVRAVERRLSAEADVIAVEVASTSLEYAWAPSGDVTGVDKRTLFPQSDFEALGSFAKIAALFRVLRGMDFVFFGLPTNLPEVIVLSFLLPLFGVKVVMGTDSKYDDKERSNWREALKRLLYRPYHGVIVAGRRQAEFMRMLGFAKRPILPGYDTLSVERIMQEGGVEDAAQSPFAGRDFLFVGRFVGKKNVPFLIDAYASYVRKAGAAARRLILVGDGPDMSTVRGKVAEHGLADKVEFRGFLQPATISAIMARALALLVCSSQDQWALVVNEGIACGIPVVASQAIGASDLLVRHLRNGYVLPSDDADKWAQAMLAIASDEATWEQYCAASRELQWAADSERYADAVETMILRQASPSLPDTANLAAQLRIPLQV